MSAKRNKKSFSYSIFSFAHYIFIFVGICIVVSISIFIFFAGSGSHLPSDYLIQRGTYNIANIFFLSLLFTVALGAFRKWRIEKPVRQILSATERIKNGDFSEELRVNSRFRSEFDEIADNINAMAKELSSVETLRSDFIANVSHELKTPLSVIQNYATMLQSSSISDSERIEYARSCAAASRRLTALITNILKLNKLENQQIFPSQKRFNLSEQITECLLDFEQVWEEKSIEIETNIADGIMIRGDEELLSLVWHNLFSNAFKFTHSGGSVSVSLCENTESVSIIVCDTGIGIKSADVSHIFEKFYQADTSHATKGNGLGLALVKRVLDICKGEIKVESTEGKGSCFSVFLRKTI